VAPIRINRKQLVNLHPLINRDLRPGIAREFGVRQTSTAKEKVVGAHWERGCHGPADLPGTIQAAPQNLGNRARYHYRRRNDVDIALRESPRFEVLAAASCSVTCPFKEDAVANRLRVQTL
jgi:hypothetical protein